ncbi:Cilia- And Flagella-Associated Protein 74, partial [Manis pentadactyla]
TEDRRQVPQVPPPLAKRSPKRARTDQCTAASGPRRPRPTRSPAEGLSVAAGDWRRGGARVRGERRGFQAGICRREGGRKGEEGLSAHPFRTLPGPSAERRQNRVFRKSTRSGSALS